MENQNINKENDEIWQRYENSQRRGKVFGGLLIVVIGALFLGRELGVEIPHWIFSWKTLLIGIGIVMGFKHGFARPGWMIAIVIGSVFLIADFFSCYSH